MNNVMLDLETMGISNNSAILSVGAVFFDDKGLGKEFHRHLDLEDSSKYGEIDASTVMWWLGQSQEARDSILTSAKVDCATLAWEFKEFLGLGGKDVKVWGNGSDFDNVILGNLYQQLELNIPWKYYNSRCYRTAVKMLGKVEIPFEGTPHNALDDAKHQAQILIKSLVGLREGLNDN